MCIISVNTFLYVTHVHTPDGSVQSRKMHFIVIAGAAALKDIMTTKCLASTDKNKHCT